WLVFASERLQLRSHEFRCPLAGSSPYTGHFLKDLAEREAAALEREGYDAAVSGSAAYNTPLPISDPLPSSLLSYDAGALAETLIHELAHGTLYVKNRTEFDEAVATWIGLRGAEAFLRERFGEDSLEMKEWREGLAGRKLGDDLYRELKDMLTALYEGPEGAAEKLEKRKAIFEWARRQAASRGVSVAEPLNNAVVLAHGLYAPDLAPFDALFEKNGRDWPKTLAAFKALP
ncbi:MAG: aminopeptidase, partial [Elusimicrobiota bacterium]